MVFETEAGRAVKKGILWIFPIWVLMLAQANAAVFDVIISGSGGEDEYSERFDDWGQRLRRVLIERCDHPAANVLLVNETGENADGASSITGIRNVFRGLSERVTPDDDVFIFLIGHGSYRRQVAKLNIPGADLTAEDLDEFLKMLSVRRIIVVNGASMSAPFVNALSRDGRIICASTRSMDQRNATQFMRFFVQALEDGSADQNRDDRISVLEICTQASSLTDAWFLSEGLIATENAILDDNGDGLGTRLSDIDAGDGMLADRCFLLNFRVPKGASPALVAAYGKAIDEVQVLVKKKATMDSAAYYQLLERGLVKAAKLNREIRSEK
ncbi:MAG: hypothetical protein F4X51_04610 [Gemmatimonadetes bacterium]|nr:hypothetical protein [Gemmatimonadota bacterium]